MSELLLTGLDGKNPLGFLAALGALSALSEAISQNSASTEQAGDWDTRHAITA